jgi:hypothetical protein
VPKNPNPVPKQYKVGDCVKVSMHGGKVVDATIKAIIDRRDALHYQIDFGNQQTALVGEWQIVRVERHAGQTTQSRCLLIMARDSFFEASRGRDGGAVPSHQLPRPELPFVLSILKLRERQVVVLEQSKSLLWSNEGTCLCMPEFKCGAVPRFNGPAPQVSQHCLALLTMLAPVTQLFARAAHS